MKVLKTVGIVVGAVALVASGIGLAIGGAVAAGSTVAGSATFLGIAGSAWTSIGAIAAVAGGVLGLGATLLTPRPSFGNEGNPLRFQTNPNSGLPYAIGRTLNAGLKIAGKTANSAGWPKDDLLFFAALLSCAPIQAVEAFTADNVSVSFNSSTGQAVTGDYVNWMSQKVSLGPTPQPAALSLSLNGVSMPGWTSAHKLSGMPHALWALRYDSNGKHYEAGPPEPKWIIWGRLCYDPRKDSTYPGGSGSHRANDESTWEWSRNPAINALAWCIGRFANGKKVAGIGAPIANIRVADFVEAANVADANGWGLGGVEYTTAAKWDVLVRMLQAGGAVPTMSGAMIGCRVQTPRVSIVTIPAEDLLDDLVYPATKSRRPGGEGRFNTVLPRYVSEANGWEVITGTAVSVPAYVTADGGIRSEGIDFPLVQAEIGQAGFDGNRQAGQLAAYAIVNSREAGPIEFTTRGFKYVGVYSGDCVTLNAPTEGFAALKLVITGRKIDIAAGVIRFTAETETDSKHPFALGQSTTPPAATTLTTPPAPITVTPIGANQLHNSRFGDGINQWALHWNGEASNSTFYPSGGKAVLHCPAPAAGAGKVIGEINPHDGSPTYAGKHLFRFAPGQRIAFRLKAAANRGNFRMVPYWRLLALSPVGDEAGSRWATDGVGQFAGFAVQIDATHGETAGYIDHPGGSTVYWLDFAIYTLSDSDTSPIDISIEAAQLSYIDPAQVVPPNWEEGPTGEYRATYGANSSNLQVGVSANRAITTRFIDSYAPWSVTWDEQGGSAYNLDKNSSAHAGLDWVLSTDGTLGLWDQRAGTATPSAGHALDVGPSAAGDYFHFPCEAGDRIEAQALLGVHRCDASVVFIWYDANKAWLGEDVGDSGGPYNVVAGEGLPGGKYVSGYKFVWRFKTMPAGAKYYRVLFRKFGTYNGQVDSWLMLSRPYWGKALPNQTEPSPWSPGPEYLGNILSDIASIAADGVLSKGEKPQMDRDWNAIYSNWYQLDAKASAIGGLGSVQTAAYSAVGALSTYLGSLSPAWNDVTTDTNISASAMKTAWINAYGAVAALQAAIQGRPGSDGAPAISVSPAPSITVPCYASGTPKGAIPGFSLKVFQGSTDVTSSASYSISQTGVIGVTHSGGGVFSGPTGMSALTGTVSVTVSYAGQSQTATATYSKALDGAAASSQYVSFPVAPTSTSYGTSTMGPVGLYCGQNGTFEMDMDLFYSSSSGSFTRLAGKWQYRASSSGDFTGIGWTDVASESTGTNGNNIDDGELFTSISMGHSGPPTYYQFQFLMRRMTATAVAFLNGQGSVSWYP